MDAGYQNRIMKGAEWLASYGDHGAIPEETSGMPKTFHEWQVAGVLRTAIYDETERTAATEGT